jgi:Terminase large subunit, T4likevirus-type, N-terminal
MVSLSEDLKLALDRAEFARMLGLIPDPWQRDLLKSKSDRILLNCCRQSGKSTMAALIALHEAVYSPSSLTLILAPAERQAKETFSKVLTLYRTLGHTIPPDSSRKLGIELSNASRIEALPGSQRTVRGFSGVDLLILDEASRVDDDLFYATRPMLAVSGGTMMMLSTPYGKRGVFYYEWTQRERWQRFQITADQVPRISAQFLEEERRTLGSRWFEQEYMCVFGELEGAVFSHDTIERMFDTPYELLWDPQEAEMVE